MRTATLRNVARNALRPSYFPVMVRKLKERMRPAHRDEAVRWAAAQAEDVGAFARSLDPELWWEAGEWAASFEEEARAKLARLDVQLGGGGHYQLLYFLVRRLRPGVVLETGVAAGWSSQAVLTAMAANGAGTLYSSDFPYFRLEDPERYVGVLVDESLREGWHLRLEGDRANLAAFLPTIERIALFHYDSDKSIEGREFAMRAVAPKLAPDAVIVMDDIDDNTWFRDWVQASGRPFRVFERGGKYVGLVGC
jgi:predicted O-methyltransferase YrrM